MDIFNWVKLTLRIVDYTITIRKGLLPIQIKILYTIRSLLII